MATTPRRAQLEPKTAERISTLGSNPAFQELHDVVAVMREQFFANMAAGLCSSSRPVNQREVDEKRGFWLGAMWVVERLVKQAGKEFEVFLAQQMEEADRT